MKVGRAQPRFVTKVAPARVDLPKRTAPEVFGVRRPVKTDAPATVEASLPPALRAGLAKLYAAVPPHSSQRVVQVGAGLETAKPYLTAGATVIALDSSREKLDAAKVANLRFHHLAEGTLSSDLPAVGIRDRNADLVIATGLLPSDLSHVAAALDAGGVFAWLHEGDENPPPGLELVSDAAAGDGLGYDAGAKLMLARKPGTATALPSDLERMDRTTCVDRAAVLKAHASPPLTGPLSLKVVSGSDVELHRELAAMLNAVKSNPRIEVTKIPWPSRVAREATQGKPGCDGLVLLAHPDDETGFSGGTLRAAADAGKSIRIASVTGGEGGQSAGGLRGAALATTRGQELQHVSELLGAQGIELMGFSDFGKYVDTQRSRPATRADALEIWGLMPLVEKMVRSIRENRPAVLLTFDTNHDPDYALHGHHLATGLAASLAFHLAGDPSAFPEQGLKPWTPLRQQGVSSFEREGPRFTHVAVDGARKREALEAHGTQVYSLEKMFQALDERQPYALTENWNLAQARDGGEMSGDSTQRLFG